MAGSERHDGNDRPDLETILRLGPSEVVDETPPGDLWARVAAEATGSPNHNGRRPRPVAGRSSDPVVGGRSSASASAGAPRRRLRVASLALCAVGVVLLVTGLVARATRSSSDDVINEVAELDRLDDFGGAGFAELHDRELTVEVAGLEPTDGAFYELWLLDLDDGRPVGVRSLGPIAGDGTYTVPADVDLGRFDVVDISVEPDDGDPAHSGRSVLQGRLAPA